MTVNEKALRKAVKAMEKYPEKWDQADWATGKVKTVQVMGRTLNLIDVGTKCNTTHCLAGWVTQQAGWLPLVPDDDEDEYDLSEPVSVGECINMETGETARIDEKARDILGLSSRQANVLFSGSAGDKSIEKFKRLITRETGVTFPEKKKG